MSVAGLNLGRVALAGEVLTAWIALGKDIVDSKGITWCEVLLVRPGANRFISVDDRIGGD